MILENEQIKVEFNELGGEIQSVFHKKFSLQYMYGGDTEYWAGKNPTLFPIVGNTFSKDYTIDNKTYAMKNHGFIRTSILDVTCSEEEVCFTLTSNNETLAVYPFEFTYQITYRLNGASLEVEYQIKNESNKVMPFTFGLHPGFLCPLEEGESFEDYTFSFGEVENCEQWDFTTKKYHNVNVKDISLAYELFEQQPTLIYKGIQSTEFTMKGKVHGVKLDTKGNEKKYPILALWTPAKNAPFLCIEPWYATGDLLETEKNFYKRDGTILLEEKEVFETKYHMTFF